MKLGDDSNSIAVPASGTGNRLFTAFRDATGMGIRLISVDGNSSSNSILGADNPFCALLASREDVSKLPCAGRKIQVASPRESPNQRCEAGLLCFKMPVVRAGVQVATLQAGQIFLEPPSEGELRSFLERFPALREGAGLCTFKAAYFQTPQLEKRRLDGAIHLLYQVAQTIGPDLLRMATSKEFADTGHINRARKFIEAHIAEQITLRQAARHLKLCPAYFCRLFKRESGCTFFAYLAKLRVERAQQLLQCSAKPITEIGYAVGFQSLWNFNRVFKRHTGVTPSEYRAFMSCAREPVAFEERGIYQSKFDEQTPLRMIVAKA